MKQLTLLLISMLVTSLAFAQIPSDRLFEKYKHKKGVQFSMVPMSETVSLSKRDTTSLIKIISIQNDEDDKSVRKLFSKVKQDCLVLFKHKDYVNIVEESQDEEILKVCSYLTDNIIEVCELEFDENELRITSTITKINDTNEKIK